MWKRLRHTLRHVEDSHVRVEWVLSEMQRMHDGTFRKDIPHIISEEMVEDEMQLFLASKFAQD